MKLEKWEGSGPLGSGVQLGEIWILSWSDGKPLKGFKWTSDIIRYKV